MEREPRVWLDRDSVSMMSVEDWDAAPTSKCVYERDPETGDWRLRMCKPGE
jgi:hypothetical protein